MKYRAVIFDLFGTVVDEIRYQPTQAVRYREAMGEIAAILGIPFDDFSRMWSAQSQRRDNGETRTVRSALAFISATLDTDVAAEQLDRACAVRLEFIRQALRPRNGVVKTLSILRYAGARTGLISNCSSDVSDLWPSTPFPSLLDASILSCDVGMLKPDPGIYRLACERLGVEPSECLFIGDGGSGELTGAANVGMDAVLIRAPDDTENGDREDWQGVRISSVVEVLSLVK